MYTGRLYSTMTSRELETTSHCLIAQGYLVDFPVGETTVSYMVTSANGMAGLYPQQREHIIQAYIRL